MSLAQLSPSLLGIFSQNLPFFNYDGSPKLNYWHIKYLYLEYSLIILENFYLGIEFGPTQSYLFQFFLKWSLIRNIKHSQCSQDKDFWIVILLCQRWGCYFTKPYSEASMQYVIGFLGCRENNELWILLQTLLIMEKSMTVQ